MENTIAKENFDPEKIITYSKGGSMRNEQMDAMMAKTPAEQTPIKASFTKLSEAVKFLTESLDKHEQRIEAVLSPAPVGPSKPQEGTDPQIAKSQIAQAFETKADQIMELAFRLSGLTQRVEL